MPTINERLLFLAMDARERAEEVLSKAETFSDPEARRIMRDIAAKYVKLAEGLEQVAGRTAANE